MTIPAGAQFDPRIIVELVQKDGFSVTIGDDNPDNLYQPCINIDLKRDRLGETNKGVVKIRNLSDDMKAKVRLGEFNKILVRAGFLRANNIANIWEGTIRKSRSNDLRGGGCETIIYTTEGHSLFVRATINKTFSAGTTPLEMVNFVLAGIPEINRGDLSGITGREPIKKPYTAVGSVREFFDDLMRTYDARWSVQRSTLDWIGNGTYSKAFQVTLKNFSTGLYDADLDEAAAFALMALDPAVDPNSAVQLEHSRKPGVNGFWRTNQSRHHGSVGGGNDCIFTEMIGEKLEGVRVVTDRQERIPLRA